MSDPRITDEAVEAAAKAIYETPHDSLSRDGYSRANRDIQKLYLAEAEAALKAALPHLIDDGAALPVRRDGEGNLAAAPSSPQPVERSALEQLLDLHRIEAFNGSQVVCECNLTWVTSAEYRAHLAAAVLALLDGSQATG